MKININVTLTLTPEQVRSLVKISKMSGGANSEKDKDRIKRYLENRLRDVVDFCPTNSDD